MQQRFSIKFECAIVHACQMRGSCYKLNDILNQTHVTFNRIECLLRFTIVTRYYIV